MGRLARRFGLSRTTLLYYDRIGLLRPSTGGSGAYRHCTQAEVRRLEQIVHFRAAGVPLADIRRILDGPSDSLAAVLERRLMALTDEIARLREQQRVIVGILKSDAARARLGAFSRAGWTALLAASGFSEDDMHRWHETFERQAPAEHQEFLRFLGIPEAEIEVIRAFSRGERAWPRG